MSDEVDPERLEDIRSVLDSIRRIVRVLRLTDRVMEKRFGLTTAQLFVLHRLAESEGLSASELADRAFTDQSSISVVVGRLTSRGLIARRRSSRDARTLELSLTEAGRAVVARAPDSTQSRLVAATQRMPAARLHRLAETLDDLVTRMGMAREFPGMLMEDYGPPAPKTEPRS